MGPINVIKHLHCPLNTKQCSAAKSLGMPIIEPGAAGCEARLLSIVLCSPPFINSFCDTISFSFLFPAAKKYLPALFPISSEINGSYLFTEELFARIFFQCPKKKEYCKKTLILFVGKYFLAQKLNEVASVRNLAEK